jgi:Kdo2-lipid IVA lauroyltransferase/acyltransferase
METARPLINAAETILPRVPARAQGAIAESIGTLAYLSAPRARAAVAANLAVVAPGRTDLIRKVFVNQVLQYLEVFTIPRIDRALIASIEIEGWERFTCAHRLGKGVILASAHFGPVALVGQIMTARGFALTLPIEPAPSELMRAVNRARSAQGMRLIPISAPLALHRVLKEGGVLGVLADRAVSGVGERVEFFGRTALLPSAHVALALRTGATLLPAFAWREHGRLFATIEEPLALEATGDRNADVREGVGRFARVLERQVARFPEQWTVFERVWK